VISSAVGRRLATATSSFTARAGRPSELKLSSSQLIGDLLNPAGDDFPGGLSGIFQKLGALRQPTPIIRIFSMISSFASRRRYCRGWACRRQLAQPLQTNRQFSLPGDQSDAFGVAFDDFAQERRFLRLARMQDGINHL
jgi:hypothetical protein